MIDPPVMKAMLDGLLRGVEQPPRMGGLPRPSFNVYRQQRPDLQQQERTTDGLMDIALTAAEMLALIEQLAEKHDDA